MTRLAAARIGLLAAALLCSFIELGVSAGLVGKIHSTTFFFSDGFVESSGHLSVPAFANLALAVSVITLVVLGLVIIIDFVRAGALTSWVSVELGVVGVLMVLWLATAADTANTTDGQSLDCSGTTGDAATICNLFNAVEAFAFITWLILTIYFVVLLVFAIIAHNRGHTGVWQSSVRDTNFGAKHEPGIQMQQNQVV